MPCTDALDKMEVCAEATGVREEETLCLCGKSRAQNVKNRETKSPLTFYLKKALEGWAEITLVGSVYGLLGHMKSVQSLFLSPKQNITFSLTEVPYPSLCLYHFPPLLKRPQARACLQSCTL